MSKLSHFKSLKTIFYRKTKNVGKVHKTGKHVALGMALKNRHPDNKIARFIQLVGRLATDVVEK